MWLITFLCKKKLFSFVAFEVRFITARPCDCVLFMHYLKVISSTTAKLVQACLVPKQQNPNYFLDNCLLFYILVNHKTLICRVLSKNLIRFSLQVCLKILVRSLQSTPDNLNLQGKLKKV